MLVQADALLREKLEEATFPLGQKVRPSIDAHTGRIGNSR